MPLGKRKRGTIKKYKSSGVTNKMRRRVFKRGRSGVATQVRSLARRFNSTVETKDAQWRSQINVGIAHNNVLKILKADGGDLNPFQTSQGAGDPMIANSGQRIGDQITIKGVKFTGFFEGALARSKVHFRIMLIKFAKGDTPTRDTLFQGKSNNKMLDMINTERYTVVWQTKFNVQPPNSAPTGVTPGVSGQTLGSTPGVTGNRIINAWIPGAKFGKQGVIKYEDSSNSQVKFYDYRFFIMAYDWYGTPQDVNVVGIINECYSVIYYKDA